MAEITAVKMSYNPNDPEARDFIEKNILEKPEQLALKYAHDPIKKAWIKQIAIRQQIRKKLPDWYLNLDLIMPERLNAEQASSQYTAQLKASLIKGNTLVDGNGGFGVDTFYLSQSFKQTHYFEINQELEKISTQNFKALHTDIQTHSSDVLKHLADYKGATLYLDPARRDEQNNAVFGLEAYTPNIVPIWQQLKQNFSEILVKTSPMLSIHQGLQQLAGVQHIWVISHKNECKEVVYRFVKDQSTSVEISAFNIMENGTHKFATALNTPQKPLPLAEPKTYIYEPNASLLKAGVHDDYAQQVQLGKLHQNSNFYTSKELIPDFQGRAFELIEIKKAFDKKLKKGRFNVISRNFPQKASAIEAKLQLKPSAQNDFLLATTLQNGSKTFLLTKLINA